MTPGFSLRPLRFYFASFAVKGFDLDGHNPILTAKDAKKNRKGRKATGDRLG